ncbi:MAG TPA: HI0074 family nucleotidyltransferase substrate-binding subunit [Syntrophales bacterium]|jgi:nucleotidyltransferase substrate binding protein (TIGR01987 family)|nr:HI0074 family nucleotidyltransferase substrate-binding subunit [Syntrophales bacterium]
MDLRIAAFKEALDTFVYLARIDLAEIRKILVDERLIDGFQNGRAQKFEYATELCWKAIKAYLKENDGIDEAAPKKVVKAYYVGGYTTEDDYLLLLDAVEDRNRLSHIYDAETFNHILARLPEYAALFERISEHLTKEDRA